MIVANFNLSSAQLQILLAFRHDPDTRAHNDHPMHDVDHTVTQLRKLCREGYLLWHEGDHAKKQRPGYTLTPKGEMMLRVVEDELKRTLEWFAGKALPESNLNGSMHDAAAGKATIDERGKYRKTKKLA